MRSKNTGPDRAVGILEGMRVVELSAFVAVPLGGLTLRSLGADVIRVDPPGAGWTMGAGR